MKLLEIKGRNVKDVPNSERSNFCSIPQRVSHNHKTRSSAFNVVLPSERTEFSRNPLHITDEKRTYSEFPDSEKLSANLLPQFKEMLIFQVSALSYFVIFSCI